jgi:glycosyltransferase 2 family protein
MEQADGGSRMRRRWIRPAAVMATFAISLGFGYVAVRGVDFDAAWRALRASNYWWLVPSLAALATSVLLHAIRWRVLFDPERRPSLGSLTKATLIGFFFNIVLPTRAGEAARIVALKHYAGTSMAESTATVVVERIFDVGVLIALLFALVAWLPHVSWLEPAAVLAFACLAAVVVLSLFARRLSGRPTPSWLNVLARLPGLREETVSRLTRNVAHGLATLRRPRQALAALGWTFLSWFVLGLSFWFLMIGFDLGLSPLAGLLVVIATGLAFIIPSAPAAVGVFEAAGLAATSAYGVPRSQAFAYVLVLHLLNVVPYLVAGLLLLGDEARLRRASGRALAARVRSRG